MTISKYSSIHKIPKKSVKSKNISTDQKVDQMVYARPPNKKAGGGGALRHLIGLIGRSVYHF